MHPSLTELDHRPWPIPKGNWQWKQSWMDLLFLHYPISVETLRKWVPTELSIDTYEGSAWVSLVPFQMERVAPRLSCGIRLLPDFPELNLRTYVKYADKPGVWFFSLDADCWPIVIGGRSLYGLPYHKANIQFDKTNDYYSFKSIRDTDALSFSCSYDTRGELYYSSKGSLEDWLTERYCLYSKKENEPLKRVEVHHKQWPLQNVNFDLEVEELTRPFDFDLSQDSVIAQYSPGVDVISYQNETC